jgi:hypothetical protein
MKSLLVETRLRIGCEHFVLRPEISVALEEVQEAPVEIPWVY